MRTVFTVTTTQREELVDITGPIRKIVGEADHSSELCCLFVPGATAAIMIQENWDPNITSDVLSCLRQLIPQGAWLHDRIDGNGDSHIKAGIIGPSETIPIQEGNLLLGTWQNIFLCEFDGPRQKREIIVTLL
ncbi:MAG: secondary thiamine-phosphate synthase enzyme YjbQ [Syntrophales bacterium]|jgi:secondary thiamine-phosphate synthase enzyme|nr:secondary thiamine-phosphate synthase enzyme YjbQ [Syntrophales bacterium]MCK9527165.1 secondary thiamine-phosphate synthase enzyme YjbQ [Syntrophales bacterium]MDX9921710.1 secondary thiamine-phosphate synthase enzyme YjbQ [Syntrophales bacterium]